MTVSQLSSDLQASRDRLFASVRGLGEEQFRYAPPGERWSIATHLAHLLRIERLLTERVGRALREEQPHVASTGDQNDAEPGRAQRLAVPQVIHGLLNARRELEALLASCDDAALDRAVQHERLGRVSIGAMAAKVAAHEDEHARAVGSLAREAPAAGRVTIPLTRRS